MLRVVVACLSLALVVTRARADDTACEGVGCSGHGRCYDERGEAFCLCDEGFVAEELRCAPAEEGDDIRRLRHRPGLSERIVEIALAEEGLGPFGVGRSLGTYPHELWRYLSPNEWWCTDFVAWVYRAAGAPFTGGYEGGWLVPSNDAAAAWFARNGLWVAKDGPDFDAYEPRPGDYVRFSTLRGGHSALVVEVDGDTLFTIEGNVDNGVRRERYDDFRAHPSLDGFGRATLPNAPPEVRVSEALEIAWPEPVTAAAVVEDDAPASELSVSWDVVSGPGEVTFSDPARTETELEVSEPGTYEIEVTADDGEHAASARLVVDAYELPEPEPAPPDPMGRDGWSCGVSAAPRGPALPALLVLLAVFLRRRGKA